MLFRLEPSRSDAPRFSARWDTKPNTIDIDLFGDSEANKKFKGGTDGYAGHHTTTLSESPRIYQIDIRTPTGVVFVGTVELLVELGLYLQDSFKEVVEQFKDELRILVVCHYCGPVKVSGPPYVLNMCPNCNRHLPSDPTSQKS